MARVCRDACFAHSNPRLPLTYPKIYLHTTSVFDTRVMGESKSKTTQNYDLQKQNGNILCIIASILIAEVLFEQFLVCTAV